MGSRIGKIRKYLKMCSGEKFVSAQPDDDGVEQLEFDFTRKENGENER